VAKNTSNYLSSRVGEHLVAAELGRRGIAASVLSGNAPDVDILAFRSGKAIGIQVKAFSTGSVSVDLPHYLEIERKGDAQIVMGINQSVDPDLIFVIVKIGSAIGDDKFFILRQIDIQRILEKGHTQYLLKHGGIRPRNPDSMHAAYGEKELESFLGNWALIEGVLPK
jgi:hypothetical protein